MAIIPRIPRMPSLPSMPQIPTGSPIFSVKMKGNEKFDGAIKNLVKRGSNTGRIMRLISIRMKSFQRDHFDKEEDSLGNKWAPLSGNTIASRKGAKQGQRQRAHNILRDTGMMFNSITNASDLYSALVGTNKEQAPTHQYGDPDRNIPQREFLYLNLVETQVLLRMLKDDLILRALGAQY